MNAKDKLELYELTTMVLLGIRNLDMLRLSAPEDLEIHLFDQVSRIVDVTNKIEVLVNNFEDKNFMGEVEKIRTDIKKALFSSSFDLRLIDSIENFYILLFCTSE